MTEWESGQWPWAANQQGSVPRALHTANPGNLGRLRSRHFVVVVKPLSMCQSACTFFPDGSTTRTTLQNRLSDRLKFM